MMMARGALTAFCLTAALATASAQMTGEFASFENHGPDLGCESKILTFGEAGEITIANTNCTSAYGDYDGNGSVEDDTFTFIPTTTVVECTQGYDGAGDAIDPTLGDWTYAVSGAGPAEHTWGIVSFCAYITGRPEGNAASFVLFTYWVANHTCPVTPALAFDEAQVIAAENSDNVILLENVAIEATTGSMVASCAGDDDHDDQDHDDHDHDDDDDSAASALAALFPAGLAAVAAARA